MIKVGILALQGGVVEHFDISTQAIKNLNLDCKLVLVREKKDLENLSGLIIPGGESNVIYKLCKRAGMFDEIKKIKNIFGTCAGAVMLAKNIANKTSDQKTLELMDIKIDRNAYGRQTESFVKELNTELGRIKAIFIRAPKIKEIDEDIKVLAKDREEIVACEQEKNENYFLAVCFHPELTTTIFHEYFFKKIV